MGEVIARTLIQNDEILANQVFATSAGTANWHVGSEMDSRARSALNRAGFLGPGSAAAFANTAYLDAQDIVVVMTKEHRRDVLQRLTNPSTSVLLLRSLAGEEFELDVADPYYGDDIEFDHCLSQIKEGCLRLIQDLHERYVQRSFEV
jgi:protein-tyrosine phosphatase